MPARIQLGPPRISLAEGSSLFVSAPDGNVYPGEAHGLFVQDTRLLSRYRIRIARRRWLLFSSAPITHYSAQLYYVNPAMDSPAGTIRKGSVAMTLGRTLSRRAAATRKERDDGTAPNAARPQQLHRRRP